jgi:hypothetical protein
MTVPKMECVSMVSDVFALVKQSDSGVILKSRSTKRKKERKKEKSFTFLIIDLIICETVQREIKV